MGRILAFARLTRIEHSAMLVVAVIAAELIAGGLPAAPVLALSLIVPIFISMSSFAINDYFDVESDRENRRLDRPIVSGEIGRRGALYTAAVTLAVGLAASAFINLYAFTIALVFGALAMLYSYRMKDMLLLGNVYIAFSMAIPFVFGDFVASRSLVPSILVIFFIIFLSGLAREIHGMVRDYRGDSRARKTRNLLYYIEKGRASQLAFLLYLEAVVLSLFLFFFEEPFLFNLAYLIPILAADAMLLYVAAMHFVRSGAPFYRMARNLSLLAMGIALLSYLAAPLVHVFA